MDGAIVQVGEDGKIVYRASALGYCDRALVAARQGYNSSPPPEKLQEVFDAGHAAEEEFFAKNYPGMRSRQVRAVLAVTSRIEVVGHLDALNLGGEVWEVKSQSDEMYKKWTSDCWTTDPLWKKYAWQVSVYMLAADANYLCLIRFNRETKHFDRDYYTKPFWSYEDIRARVLSIEALAAEDGLPECEKEEWGCPFAYTHKGLEMTDDPALEKIVTYYFGLKQRQGITDELLKQCKEQITELLGERGKVLLMSGVTISKSTYTVKAHEIKESVQTRLTVTKPKDPDAPRPE